MIQKLCFVLFYKKKASFPTLKFIVIKKKENKEKKHKTEEKNILGNKNYLNQKKKDSGKMGNHTQAF